VDRDPDQENAALDQDEGPAPDHQRHPVGDALTEAELLLVLGDDVPDRRMVVRVVCAGTEPERALRHYVVTPRWCAPSHSLSSPRSSWRPARKWPGAMPPCCRNSASRAWTGRLSA